MKAKPGRYHRHSVVPLEEGLRALAKGGRVDLNGVPVKCSSLRLRTFAAKGTSCRHCGIEGAFFAIERNGSDRDRSAEERPFHLNLWALRPDGIEVLMTHDHTHARGTGGRDEIANTEPMCERCNSRKSREEGRLANALRAANDRSASREGVSS
jgi:hypothetical protein